MEHAFSRELFSFTSLWFTNVTLFNNIRTRCESKRNRCQIDVIDINLLEPNFELKCVANDAQPVIVTPPPRIFEEEELQSRAQRLWRL